jgi:hypothetical protein
LQAQGLQPGAFKLRVNWIRQLYTPCRWGARSGGRSTRRPPARRVGYVDHTGCHQLVLLTILPTRVGTFHHVILQSKQQLMAAGMVHVTNLTPPGSDNPRRAYGQEYRLVTAGMVHVTNLTPGSGGNPRRAYGKRLHLMTASMVHVTNLTPDLRGDPERLDRREVLLLGVQQEEQVVDSPGPFHHLQGLHTHSSRVSDWLHGPSILAVLSSTAVLTSKLQNNVK